MYAEQQVSCSLEMHDYEHFQSLFKSKRRSEIGSKEHTARLGSTESSMARHSGNILPQHTRQIGGR